MNTNHLTEEVIQGYILQEITDEQLSSHISECADCRAKIESYKALMNMIGNIKPERFSFDVTALVLQKIEEKESKRKVLGSYALITILSVAILGVILFSFSIIEPIIQVFRSLKAIDNASTSVAAQAFSDELVVFKFREVLLPGIAFTVRCQFNP